jgi:D-alanine-D-alanine ligase
MTQQKKIRVAVLYGGRSGEHEVSLISATNVIQQLDRNLFDVIPIGIDKEGAWFLGDDLYNKELTAPNAPRMLQLQRDAERMLFNPELIGRKIERFEPQDLLPQTKNSDRMFDVVFPVIHGTLCEDGTVQGLLELANLPYVGCGVLASSVGMDKDVSKRLVANAGIAVAPFVVVKLGHWEQNPDYFCDLVAEQLQYPVFVKPANTGSSVGVHKVKKPEDLVAAIEDAFRYDVKIIIETGIDAVELEVAALESDRYGADPIMSVVGEITPTNNHEFYSYAAKYLDENGAALQIPASVSAEIQEEVREVAKKIFAVLDCEGMARIDLFMERGTKRIYFNEINSIPGFTQISMYPKLMAASGVSYSQLLTHLVKLAIARHERKSKLCREFAAN